MPKNPKELSTFCQILMIIAFLDFIGGIYMLVTLWETSHYIAIMWFVGGLGSVLFIYTIIQVLSMLANIERNTNKTQEYLEVFLKALSKK